MFWAIARGRGISAQEMQNRAQSEHHYLASTSTSSARIPTSGQQSYSPESRFDTLSRQTSSSASDDQSDRMILDDDKTPLASKDKDPKYYQQREARDLHPTLQDILRAERKQANMQNSNQNTYDNGSTRGSITRR